MRIKKHYLHYNYRNTDKLNIRYMVLKQRGLLINPGYGGVTAWTVKRFYSKAS